jgi:hypothetical protein
VNTFITLPESGAVPRANSSRHRPEYSRHSLCREGTLGTAHSAPLGRHRALCREPPQMLSAHVCREATWLSAEEVFPNKKNPSSHAGPPASTATPTDRSPPPPQHRRLHHPSCAAHTTPALPLPPRAHHHHCCAHTVDATTAMRTLPLSSTHHHRLRRHRAHTTTVAAQNRERAGGEKGEGPVAAPGRGRRSQSRRGGATRSGLNRREGRAVGEPLSGLELLPWRGIRGRLRLLDEETRREVATGSTATAPRPVAAPHHEVRGERRGEEGGGAAATGGIGTARERGRWGQREAAAV